MTEPKSTNIARIVPHVARAMREANLAQGGVTVWFTGLSASGKSTVALLVDQLLTDRGHHCCVLDGDNIRRGLNSDLGFSPEDRNENIRRIGEVAKLFATNGSIALTAFISPYRADRERNRRIHGRGDFVEVYVECPLETCEKRDPRGLYAKARSGEIPEFTGVTAPYEPPLDAEIVLRTDRETEDESAARVVAYLESNGHLGAAGYASRRAPRRTSSTDRLGAVAAGPLTPSTERR